MAKTFGAVLGKQSGRIGQIVGRVTRGKQYFAALPTVAKDRKVSSKEQDVRLKFKTLTQLAKGFKQGIKVSLERYAKYAPYITPFNHFVKINKDTVHVEGGVAEIEYGAILLAPEGGDIPAVGFSAASFDEPLRVSVAFTPNSDVPMADADDNVYLFVYEPESGQGILSPQHLERPHRPRLRLHHRRRPRQPRPRLPLRLHRNRQCGVKVRG